MFAPGFRRIFRLPASQVNLQTVRRYAIKSRVELLKSIYGPAVADLKKDSPEYDALARSGRIWEDYFKPGNIEPYLQTQADLKEILIEIDEIKEWLQKKDNNARINVLRSLVCECAQQSTSIERNPLDLGDAVVISDELERLFFRNLDSLGLMSPSEVSNLALPTPEELLPGKNASQVAEIRNHLLVSRYITEAALKNPGTPGKSEADIKQLSRLMLRGTDSETLYAFNWGKRIQLGDYRSTSIAVRSNPLRIFPYPQEVPACMHRYIEWRDRNHADKILHPMILATHLSTYFVQIHPFPDGNGRICRVLMADYLIRQGYLPVVFVDLVRDDYIQMISEAQDGKPEDLCTAVTRTEFEMLWEISLRQ